MAANREEFHQRPTAAADFWPDQPDLLAGRDLQAGGTWMGITRTGRIAAITNYREPLTPQSKIQHSRGHLVRDYLATDISAMEQAERLQGQGAMYSGYNLLLGDPNDLVYISNRNENPLVVSPGTHGLSNHLLDTDWPKVHSGRAHLDSLLEDGPLESKALFDLLTDRTLTKGEMPKNIADSDLPEQLMRHYFIASPDYGTRCSTVLLLDREGHVEFLERQFGPNGLVGETRKFEFDIARS